MSDLANLLAQVDRLFPRAKKGPSIYNYTLGRFPQGWQFNLVNNWYAWSDRGLQHNFGLYKRPEFAVEVFLFYVEKNKINVRELCE